MATLGINLKIDVTKLDKTRFFKGKNGAQYADLTVFVDTENVGQYGDHGGIQQASTKDERQNGLKLPYCGNAKIFHAKDIQVNFGNEQAPQNNMQQGGYNNQQNQTYAPQQPAPQPGVFDAELDSDIPF